MLKKLFVSAWFIFGSLMVGATDIATYIVNGTNTSTSSYPSYARLYYNEFGNFGYCGGTFIDATHVLTAAHCVDLNDEDISEVNLLFTVAVPNLDDEDDISNAQLHYIAKFYVHEEYDSNYLINDIAILKLESAVNIGSYAEILDESSYRSDGANQTFVAVGHGNTETNEDATTVLQQAKLDYLDNSACNDYYGYVGAPDTQLCMSGAISNGLRKATCNGDSGGPLYWTDSSNNRQVGITSYGPADGCGNTSVVATSVFTEVADYATWIANVQTGLVEPTYITSESDREYYRQYGFENATEDRSKTSGGSVPFWFSIGLVVLAAGRMRAKK
ncbi:serine protease [Vibrio sp. TH_r3]|uniref:S1 family peptidase n=1 Tax=Vibrio sp. TH_r3 TaxID=3082084 RepID=UPI002955A53C|nr:serine protease [Vibrio sp. TH_r3]MDV7103832.1 serine protease [Vibrio sp. TH_r3]